MNEAATAQRRDNEPRNLGTEHWIFLYYSTNDSVEQVIAALEATTTLTNLTVEFDNGNGSSSYNPTPENNRRIVEPLCRCLSNLRCRNEHHPLRALALHFADLRSHAGKLDVFEHFLIAATKYGGIFRLKLYSVHHLPMQYLVEFCQDNNNNLKVLELTTVIFTDGSAAMSLPSNRPQNSSVTLVLDKMRLVGVSFENSTSLTAFANFFAHMTVRTLVLGHVYASDDGDDLQMTKRMLSEIKIPSVKQLEFTITCRIEHFKAALEAGTSSLVELDVSIAYDGKDDYTERLQLLTNFICRAVQLKSLKIVPFYGPIRPIPLPLELRWAIEACATVTRMQLYDGARGFIPDEVQQLQAISARNEELARFVASPSTHPTNKLLWLMRQYDNCPTGRYMLARSLPGVFSFGKIESTDSPTTEPNPKKRKMS